MGEKLEIFLKITCIGLILYQGTMLNLYLSHLHDNLWWCWYIADVFVVAVWISCLVIADKRIKQDQIDGRRNQQAYPDEIGYAYIAWLSYAACLCPRIVLLFEHDAQTLVERDILGPNFLKVAVACTPFVFLLLARSWHDAKPYSKRKYMVMSLASTITLDLFDSIDLLDFLYVPMKQSYHNPLPKNSSVNAITMAPSTKILPVAPFRATLVFACLNLFLPTLALGELKMNKFKGKVPSISLKLMYDCAFLFLVNIPNLVIRSILWHVYDMDVSVLLMKNVMCIAMGILEIYEYSFGEEKPKRCKICHQWYQKDYIDQHKMECSDAMNEKVPLTS